MELIYPSSNAAHRPTLHFWEDQGAFGLAGEVFGFDYYYYSTSFGLDFDFDYRKKLTSWRQSLNFHHGPFLPYRPCYHGRPFLPHVERQQLGVYRLLAQRFAVR